MQDNKIFKYIDEVLKNMPTSWLNLTTHRLDIYDEKLAKTGFLKQFKSLFDTNNSEAFALNELPTAYDYIRLGHPLSCILEWTIAKLNNQKSENVISFSSQTVPILAILRKNLLENKKTQINYINELPPFFDANILRNVYGYNFEVHKVEDATDVTSFDGSTIFISEQEKISSFTSSKNIDFCIHTYINLGSMLLVNGAKNEHYISDIQHVRRRETIAMTPVNALAALKSLLTVRPIVHPENDFKGNKISVLNSIKKINGTTTKPLVGSSGLSIQYAIMMGLIHDAIEEHPGKEIKIIVPPNCYGGTNDQARRVAACLEMVEVVDLPVDGDNNMVQSIDTVLTKIAKEDSVPYIIAEIPTNPRVEVPDLIKLQEVLSKERTTAGGVSAIDPVFI